MSDLEITWAPAVGHSAWPSRHRDGPGSPGPMPTQSPSSRGVWWSSSSVAVNGNIPDDPYFAVIVPDGEWGGYRVQWAAR